MDQLRASQCGMLDGSYIFTSKEESLFEKKESK